MQNKKEFLEKISPILKFQLPDFIQVDHPIYVEFLKTYFEYLESAQLYVEGKNHFLNQETNTVAFILDEQDHKIILETSSSVFLKNETIIGQTSNASAKIILSDIDDSNKLHIYSNQAFLVGEVVVGQTSGATAVITSYLSNPVQNIQQFLSYTDIDHTLDQLVNRFRDLLLESFPVQLADNLERKTLIKNVRDLYNVKGTAEAHQIFFRSVFDEPSEIFYPSERMLRASDGQWSTDTIMRVVENDNSVFTNLVGQKIYTLNSVGEIQSSAIISNVIRFREKDYVISELTLDRESIVGTFTAEETIFGIDPTIDLQISAVVKNIVTNIEITDPGFYYSENDIVTVEKIGNETSTALIKDVGTGIVDEILILDGGQGYRVNERVIFDNLNTNGVGAEGKIAIVGGSFLLEDATETDLDSTDYSLLLDNNGDFILFEDGDFIKLELPRNQNNKILSETADEIVIENERADGTTGGTFVDIANYDPIAAGAPHPHFDAMGYWSVDIANESYEIRKIKLSNNGIGYKFLPTASVPATLSDGSFNSNGTDAVLIPLSTSSPGVGNVRNIQITNFGLEYNLIPEVVLQRNIIVKGVQGTFLNGDELTSHVGTVISYDSTYSMLKIRTSQDFSPGDRIVSVTGSVAFVHFSHPATIRANVGSIAQTSGKYISDRSKISNSTIRLQDSNYYQDFSYVVKVARSINDWRNAVKRSIHPAGWNLFGEVVIADFVSASITRITNKFLTGLPSTEFSPIIFGILFGRRLGTIYQGEVRENPQRSVVSIDDLRKESILLEDNGRIILENETGFIRNEKKFREVTLSSSVTVRARDNRPAIAKKYGHLSNLPIYAFVTPRMDSDEVASNWYGINRTKSITELNKHIVDGEYYTIGQFSSVKINEVSDTGYLLFDEGLSGDGDKIILEDGTGYLKNEFIHIPATAYSKNINVPPPAEVILSNAPRESLIDAYSENEENQDFWTAKFSEIGITWDRTDFTFDDGVLTSITVNLTSSVVKSGFTRGISLANLPIYAFVTPRMDTDDVASNWYGINRTISDPNVVDGEYYTISQFARFKINEVAVPANVLQENNDLINLERGSQDLTDSFETNINTFDSDLTFDSGTEYVGNEDYKIPEKAYRKIVNVPPPGEIVLKTS